MQPKPRCGYFFSQYPSLSTFFLENSPVTTPAIPVVFLPSDVPRAVGRQMTRTDLSSSAKPHIHRRISLRQPLRCGFTVLLCSCLFAGAAQCRAQASQDVAEAARQERARKDAKTQKHVYTDEDLHRAKILTPEDDARVEARGKQQPAPVEEQAKAPADGQIGQLPLGDIARRYRNAKL